MIRIRSGEIDCRSRRTLRWNRYLVNKRGVVAQGSATDDTMGPQRLGMLASALAGRTVAVVSGGPGEPAYTDGVTVYVDPTALPQRQLDAVSVQASLLAAGAFAPDILRKLARRPKLASRYLAIEGHRALAANDDLLPPAVRRLVNLDLAASVDSPAASLALAGTGGSFAAPDCFGEIKVRRLLAVVGGSGDLDPSRAHLPRRNPKRDLPDLDEDDDVAGGDVPDLFSSPAGGSAVVGKLLQRLMSRVRRLSGGGPPGADAATHRSG
ncbi:hypothetical protein, partial [Micromonospora sp. WMMD736]|uniref:hypothetical protein n=1 Tax=Micromonospora sp. WMMD736 TaxID=3404112 RepID=UPI003B95AD4A